MKKQGKTLLTFLFLGLLFFTSNSLQARPIHTIQQNIFLAKSGDYAVFSRGAQRIFILVKSASSDSVCLEIIDFPSLIYSERSIPQEISWKTAIHKLKSPAKVFVVSLSKKETKVFSFCQKTKNLLPILDPRDAPLIMKFFQIPLSPAPQHLIKIGKNDRPWSPKVSIEESSEDFLTTEALHGSWPKDPSPLSGADILMYFTHSNISVFPLWASISTPKGTSVLRALNVGHQATSPYEYSLPHVVP